MNSFLRSRLSLSKRDLLEMSHKGHAGKSRATVSIPKVKHALRRLPFYRAV